MRLLIVNYNVADSVNRIHHISLLMVNSGQVQCTECSGGFELNVPFTGSLLSFSLQVNRRMLDAMRPLELTAEMREEGGFIPYMPEIPIPSEEMVNYNQTVHNVRGIKMASVSPSLWLD